MNAAPTQTAQLTGHSAKVDSAWLNAAPTQIVQRTGHSAMRDSAWLNATPTQTAQPIGHSAKVDSAWFPLFPPVQPSVHSMAWAVVHRHKTGGNTWAKDFYKVKKLNFVLYFYVFYFKNQASISR